MDILLACIGMLLRDGLGTLLVVAEARGRALLASILVTIFGAGEVIQHGWTTHTVILIAAMTTTSLLGTTQFTKLSQRITPAAIPAGRRHGDPETGATTTTTNPW